MGKKFDLSDVLLTPAVVSGINSRSKVNVNTEEGALPLITAPMDTVIGEKNWLQYFQAGIIPCLPRGAWHLGTIAESVNYATLKMPVFLSYSLDEIESPKFVPVSHYICVDVANGHMLRLHNAIRTLKEKWGTQIEIMTGNIANPLTYTELALAGADWVRVNIGTGNACLTSKQTSIGYPMASLIEECRSQKNKLGLKTKIVADGGMKDYSDIIKALALGADYVMVGSLFNKCIESSGENYWHGIKINESMADLLFASGFKIHKKYRGMSTKEVQKAWGKKELKTSEGIVTKRPVEYRLKGWTHNFTDYLKSAMSYCGKGTLSEFIGKTSYTLISPNVYRRFDK